MMNLENLIVVRLGAVASVTVNRQKVLNALNERTMNELHNVMLEFKEDSSVRCIILTGSGKKAFIAGADINELAQQTSTEGAASFARFGQRVFDLIEQLGKPVIAAVNGYALGGGCELAMACTLRLAANNAKFGQPEIGLGIIPGYGGSQRLARLVGKGRALELLLTGDQVTAEEAWRIGLVNRVVPAESLMSEANSLAKKLAEQAPIAVRYIINVVHEGLQMSLAEGNDLEAKLFGRICTTDDMREGTKAFLEKRPAIFKGK